MLYPDLSNTNLVLRIYTIGEKKKKIFFPLPLTSKRCAVEQGIFRVRIFFLICSTRLKKVPGLFELRFLKQIYHTFLIIENFKKRTIFSMIILLKKSAFEFNISFIFCLPHVPNSF